MSEEIEKLSEEFHDVYIREVARQGKPLRHPEKYSDLKEDIKDYDRALASYVLNREASLLAEVEKLKKERDAYMNRAYYYIAAFYDDPSITYREQVDAEAKRLIERGGENPPPTEAK